jgi:hypothetical protein
VWTHSSEILNIDEVDNFFHRPSPCALLIQSNRYIELLKSPFSASLKSLQTISISSVFGLNLYSEGKLTPAEHKDSCHWIWIVSGFELPDDGIHVLDPLQVALNPVVDVPVGRPAEIESSTIAMTASSEDSNSSLKSPQDYANQFLRDLKICTDDELISSVIKSSWDRLTKSFLRLVHDQVRKDRSSLAPSPPFATGVWSDNDAVHTLFANLEIKKLPLSSQQTVLFPYEIPKESTLHSIVGRMVNLCINSLRSTRTITRLKALKTASALVKHVKVANVLFTALLEVIAVQFFTSETPGTHFNATKYLLETMMISGNDYDVLSQVVKLASKPVQSPRAKIQVEKWIRTAAVLEWGATTHSRWNNLLRTLNLRLEPTMETESTIGNCCVLYDETATAPPPSCVKLRLFSWNVNGFRKRWTTGNFQKVVEETEFPDVLVITESKLNLKSLNSLSSFHEWRVLHGYTFLALYWSANVTKGGAGYCGVLILSKYRPLKTTFGIGNSELDTEARLITLQFQEFIVT